MLLTFYLKLDSLTARLLTFQLNLMRIWYLRGGGEGGKPLSNPSLYRRLVGSLVYLTVTRPNISYAVHQVSQYLFAPWSTHYAAVLRILRYLKGTLFHSLFYSAQSPLVLHAFSNADWAEDPTDRKSTTSYCFLLGSSLISWRSKKQTFVARSSTEAEYCAFANTTSELLWLRRLLKDLGVSTSSATPIYCDNQNAIHITHNDVFHERTKHIKIDCHFIRYHLVHGALKLFSVSSKDQLADIFTKSLPKGRTRDLVNNLKLVSHPPWVWGGLLMYIMLWALGPITLLIQHTYTCTTLYLYRTLMPPI